MKKLLAACLGFFCLQALAQSNDEIQNVFETIFKPLGRKDINTLYLFDKTAHYSNIARMDGVADTAITSSAWEKIYNEVYNYRADASAYSMPAYDESSKLIQAKLASGINPIIVFDFKYNRIKDDAFEKGLLEIKNNQFTDNPNRSESPYLEKNLFAATPARFTMGHGKVTFQLSPQFYFSNNAITGNPVLPQLEIDFNDGMGYRPVVWGQQITINYTDTQVKTIKIRHIGNDKIARSLYQKNPPIHNLTFNTGQVPNKTSGLQFKHEVGEFIDGVKPYNGTLGRGLVTVSYAYDNSFSGGRRTCLKRPIIFVEGIDFQFNELNNGFDTTLGKCNSLGYIDIKDGYKQYKYCDARKTNKYYWEAIGYNLFDYSGVLIEDLNTMGYDFVYIDFEDGATYMQSNAYALVSLIEEINKTKCSCEENIVVGASMGGQVSRYALSYMEKNGIDHQVRIYTSFDSPNNGANIPVGFLATINYFAGKNFFALEDFKKKKASRIDRPAVKQLLVAQHDGNPDPLRATFLQELEALGSYPKNCRKIAIVNSSGTGIKQNFNAGDKLFHFELPVSTAAGTTLGLTVGSYVGGVVGGPVGAGYGGTIGAIVGGLIGNYIVKDYEATGYAVKANSIAFEGTSPFDGTTYLHLGSGFLPYDNAAGSQNDAIGAVPKSCEEGIMLGQFGTLKPISETVAGMIFEPYINFHSFMPISTTLGFKPPYDRDFDYAPVGNLLPDNPDPSITPFEAYFAPGISVNGAATASFNEPHVKITEANTTWFKQQIELNRNNLDTYFSGTYNFGNRFRRRLYSVTIQDGGSVYVNNSGNTDHLNGQATVPGSTFELITLDCSMVSINNNSKLVLGNNQTENKAIVRFVAGSSLQIAKGGKLIIHDNSRLIIEKGASLSFLAGAEIQLLGENSVLEISGSLILGKDATFTFTYPGAQSGYVKFNHPENFWPPTKNINVYGLNNKIIFEGANKNDKVLEVTQEGLYAPDNLNLFEIKKGRVELGENSRISIGCAFKINQATITSNTGSFNAHRGVHVYGQAGSEILFSDFKYGIYGVYAPLFYGNNVLNISSSSFENCGTGLYTEGKGINITNVSFKDNNYGWASKALNSHSNISNCTFNNNDIGISAWGSGGATINLLNSKIISNKKTSNFGIEVEGATLNASCSSINEQNETGISLYSNAILNMSTSLKAGYVDASGNGLTIYAENARTLFLDQGNNNLAAKNNTPNLDFICDKFPNSDKCRKLDIKGTLMLDFGNGKYNNCPPVIIQANYNKWGHKALAPVSGFEYDLKTSAKCRYDLPNNKFEDRPVPIYLADNSPIMQKPNCNQGGNSGNISSSLAMILNSCPPCVKINTKDFNNVKLNEAVKQTLEIVSTDPANSGNNKKAVDLFHQILEYPITNPATEEKLLIDLSYRKMQEALSNAYLLEEIKNHNGIPTTETEQMLAIQNKKIQESSGEGKYLEHLFYTMEEAQTQIMADKRGKAVTKFDEMESWISFEEKKYVSKWKCFTEVENRVLNGEITKEEFEHYTQACDKEQKKFVPFASETQALEEEAEHQNTFAVYPNPSAGNIFVQSFLIERENILIEVTDMYGKSVWKALKALNEGANTTEVTLPELNSGIYFIVITSSGNIHTEKINIFK